ncbi:MFS transporter, partial [Streptomyces sp. NPDC005803]|uniref:MFS transporter n=1 Tax=Streptomyces sp. NPDC005803 TaxID=3154297 RepID=UPI0033C6846F
PALGGLLVQSAWQWVFLINVPIGALALATSTRLLSRPHRSAVLRGIPDVVGGLVLALTIGALTLTLAKGPAWGWASTDTATGLLVTVAGVGIFRHRTLRHPLPLVAPSLLGVKIFTWSNVTSVLFNVAFGANVLAMILWMQQAWGYSALRTGMAVAPGPLVVLVATAFAQYAARRLSARALAVTGCVLFALPSVLLALRVGPHPHYVAEMLPPLIISGIDVGLTLPTVLASATAALPAPSASTGSAVVNMSQQIGTSLGVALLVAALTQHTPSGHLREGFAKGWWMVTGAAVLAMVSAWGITPGESRARSLPVESRRTFRT